LEFPVSQTVGDFLVQRLHDWDVSYIFGYPGDGINGVFGALNRADGKLQFIQALHEEMAAFMASAYAEFSGRLGVCIATSGPGASHLITGLYDALLDHQPVLAIVGQQARNALGRSSTWFRCSRMLPAPMSRRLPLRRRSDI
jgi:pyruvate dehydrogenase (quinone)